MKSFVKFLLLVALANLLSVYADASITEIRKDILNQTSLLSPTAIISAPSANGSYYVCWYLSTSSTNGPEGYMGIVLSWTDENGLAQSQTNWPYIQPNGSENWFVGSCFYPIRNKANTAATISTIGSYAAEYNLFVTGLGFWTTGSQGQGGLSESVSREFVNETAGTSVTLLTPAATGTYLLVAAGSLGSPSFKWTDEYETVTETLGGMWPLHAVGGSPISVTFNANQSGTGFVKLIYFGTPATGSGPITDTEYDMLGWTNATWPSWETVLSTNGGYVFGLLGNIAEVPNYIEVPEQLAVSLPAGVNGSISPPAAQESGAPSGFGASGCCVFYVPSSSNPVTLQVQTQNATGQEWGTSPTYSVEIEALQFQ